MPETTADLHRNADEGRAYMKVSAESSSDSTSSVLNQLLSAQQTRAEAIVHQMYSLNAGLLHVTKLDFGAITSGVVPLSAYDLGPSSPINLQLIFLLSTPPTSGVQKYKALCRCKYSMLGDQTYRIYEFALICGKAKHD
ncbi:unnamed protein product [Gongylonema pulchrum]|uniref:Non-specific serine/threonine protein kinase n=1 Tax=Gongylonema pulchrum TaxID=637853 RepID=A0A183DNL9_9BILA|nr:unnamed protein product [Gongylonema pulchrum]